jgi:secreted PhoX family phosphatase
MGLFCLNRATDPDRRLVLKSAAAAVAALLGEAGFASSLSHGPNLGFTAVPASLRDAVVVPPEYEYRVLYRWGDPTGIGSALPAFRPDASNTAEDQALQAGMHHDGMHFFPLGSDGRRALLVLNHEYTDEHQLHADGAAPLTAAKVRKSQHAVGVSVIEIERSPSGWRQVLPSGYARRIHARTPMHIAGPAAGSALLQTAADPSGRVVLGTLANCAMGVTPWGTYLTCEENFHGYFGADKSRPGTSDAAARRYGTTPGGQWVDWYRFDERFDVLKHPNEPTASAGWSRSTRWTRPPRPSSAPHWAASARKAPPAR